MTLPTEKDLDDLYSRQRCWTEHVVGETVNCVQLCLRCGKTICDYRGAMASPNPDGSPHVGPILGFPAGKVYQSGNCSMVQRPNQLVVACGVPD